MFGVRGEVKHRLAGGAGFAHLLWRNDECLALERELLHLGHQAGFTHDAVVGLHSLGGLDVSPPDSVAQRLVGNAVGSRILSKKVEKLVLVGRAFRNRKGELEFVLVFRQLDLASDGRGQTICKQLASISCAACRPARQSSNFRL